MRRCPSATSLASSNPPCRHLLTSADPRPPWWIPLADKRVPAGGVEPHGEIEPPLRRRQPIGLLLRARAFVLKIEVERAVGVVEKGHPAAEGETAQAVRHLEAFLVIERDRPECAHRRRGALVEADRIAVGAFERLAPVVEEVEGIDR